MNDSKKTQILTFIILIALLISVIICAKRDFTLQYVVDGELHTETYDSPKKYNQRVDSLKANGIEVYLSY